MKINKSDPAHWLYLILSTLTVMTACILRPFSKKKKSIILLYGHKLNGNLASLYKEKREIEALGFKLFFLTMEPSYFKILIKNEIDVLLLTSKSVIPHLIQTNSIISDHGLHALSILLRFSSVKFFDVWHGIPFKGFDSHDFKLQHQYDEIWVSSDHIKQMYIEKFGFDAEKVVVTGYGRTDRLVNFRKVRDENYATELRKQFNLPSGNRKIILFAPTWKQDDKNRDELPFGLTVSELLIDIKEICEKQNAIFVIRSHLNTSSAFTKDQEQIFIRSFSEYPDSEGLLILTDILICDWSSISFDYLILDRPTIFLDVPPPFKKGFSLGPEYRFGKIIKDIGELYESISNYLQNIETYNNEFLTTHQMTKEQVYGNTCKLSSTSRYLNRLSTHLNPAPNKSQFNSST